MTMMSCFPFFRAMADPSFFLNSDPVGTSAILCWWFASDVVPSQSPD